LQLDLTRLTLPDESWDVVICYHVFEHIPDDRAAMREMYRVLKPGGWAVVQVPVRDVPETLEDPTVQTAEERVRLFGQRDHVRYYGWRDFADRLEDAGFEVTIERFGRELSAEDVKTYALNPNERIYHLRKPASAEDELPLASAGESGGRVSTLSP
jgi:ubiquinone/menaquinone biosynthesis C-methylase UbiE